MATVPTTSGDVDVDDLGVVLMHEHVFIRTESFQWGWPGFGYYTYDNLPFPFHYRGAGKVLDGDDRLLESLFERDVTVGIGDTGIRAAVLKVATDIQGMTEDVERLRQRLLRGLGSVWAEPARVARGPTRHAR